MTALANTSKAAQPKTRTVSVGGGQIDIAMPDTQFTQISNDDLLQWIKTAATTVTQYYGHFPVSHLTLHVRADDRPGIHHGMTFPRDGGFIVIRVGNNTPRDELLHDWTMTHEMIHLAFPNMEEQHHWIEEGISTYVEPVARAAAGGLTPEYVWKQFVDDMPQGEPESGDQGLDVTHTWGRTYWGGAMFCLLADVQIRERTHNQKGLRDALRAILDHGGRITEDWSIEKAFTVGDKATGTDVLMSLYRQMNRTPVNVDLDALWKKLGVSLVDGKVMFDDKAPEAEVRKAVTRAISAVGGSSGL